MMERLVLSWDRSLDLNTGIKVVSILYVGVVGSYLSTLPMNASCHLRIGF